MERIERAIGEIQHEFRELNGFSPTRELDLRAKFFQRDNHAIMGDESGVFNLKTYPEEVEIQ